MPGAYYSEYDKNAAAWLRELIKRGLIADGEVDERDLWDVAPADLTGFTQVHLCAGIGVWSYALRRAGWPDDRRVWTGSFPCQPFSAAGKGDGFADPRHLWPAGEWLIRQCRPAVVFGEQVASKDAEPWIDLVQDDLEAVGYAVGAVPFPSAGVGAPHIRDRLYWVADAMPAGRPEGRTIAGDRSVTGGSSNGLVVDTFGERGRSWQPRSEDAGHARLPSEASELGHSERVGARWNAGAGVSPQGRHGGGAVGDDTRPSGAVRPLADTSEPRRSAPGQHGSGEPQLSARSAEHGRMGGPAGPTNGLWRDADWLLCRDGKWRPVEPGTFPLAHGAPARVGRLRGYGNAINAEAAQAWIESYLDATGERDARA